MTRENTIDTFLKNAKSVGAGTVLAADLDELKQSVSKIIEDTEPVYCPGKTDKEAAVIPPEEKRAPDYFSAQATVEEVFGAIAETGSIICSSQDGRELQAGLLPAHHVAIVARENIFATLDDFFSSLGPEIPTNITFITGPSRTADIELTLTVGVHGPERLDVIVC